MSSGASESSLQTQTGLALSLFSVLSFLLYQRNRQLVLSVLEQKRQLFLLSSLTPAKEEESSRRGKRKTVLPGESESESEAERDSCLISSPRSDSGSVCSTRSLSQTRFAHNPYVEDDERTRCVSHSVKLLQPAPVRAHSHAHFQRRLRSASEGGSGRVARELRLSSKNLKNNSNNNNNDNDKNKIDESNANEDNDGNGRAVEKSSFPKTPNFRQPFAFSKSESYFEMYREETPSLPATETNAAIPTVNTGSGSAKAVGQPQSLAPLVSPAAPSSSSSSSSSAHPHANTLISPSSLSPHTTAWTALGLEQPLVIAMVGLPARGKSYLVKMLMRYLKWTGFECKVFNVGNYRRKVGLAAANSDFFDSKNENNHKIREHLAMTVQEAMYSWLHKKDKDAESSSERVPQQSEAEKRRVAVFDATNTTKERRLALVQRARKENVFLLFVESICDDERVLRRNYELKLQNDDYNGLDPEIAMRDFLSRVQAYEKVYETVDDSEDNNNISYIKLINVGQKVITRNCHGYLPSQVAFYLQNVHIFPRKIYLSVVAESVESVHYEGYVAGQESGLLTEKGEEYVQNLADYIAYESKHDLVELGKDILVLTGTGNIHYRSVTALKEHGFKCFHTALLNELRGGDFHGYSKAELKEKEPLEFEKRMNDKLNYRYPGVGGESYVDVMERLRPAIIELERQRRSIVLVCHLAVLRCIYAYFMGVPLSEMPYKNFDYHRIYELSPGPFGCSCSVIQPHASGETQPVEGGDDRR